jgi:hypothetical protein
MYAIAFYLAAVYASYARTMKAWPARVHAEQMTKIESIVDGEVESVSSFGFGRFKDYFIQVKGYEYRLPGSIANAELAPDIAPVTDIGSDVKKGSYIQLEIMGRQDPVVIGLSVRRDDGVLRSVLNRGVGARRFELMYRQAPSIAHQYQQMAWRMIAGAILLHLLIFGLTKMRRSKTATR